VSRAGAGWQWSGGKEVPCIHIKESEGVDVSCLVHKLNATKSRSASGVRVLGK